MLSSAGLTGQALSKRNQSLGKGFHFHREQRRSTAAGRWGPHGLRYTFKMGLTQETGNTGAPQVPVEVTRDGPGAPVGARPQVVAYASKEAGRTAGGGRAHALPDTLFPQ